MTERSDTIAAIASGLATSGIGVIRISGEDAFAIADRCCVLRSGEKFTEVPSHSIRLGHVLEEGEVLDEVLFLFMRAPKTYTKEDTVEIDCHGGPYVMRRILQVLFKCGARMAEPGEFTLRAFRNGRIDLAESEAVMDLIASTNEQARRNAVAALKGSLSGRIRAMREEILLEIARIEASLDDPEHLELPGEYRTDLSAKIASWVEQTGRMLSGYENGRRYREGLRVSIVGTPNTGKSSLMNLLTGEDRAIVTQIPGTTRDLLTEQVLLDGMPLLLTDTAGIRETADEIEEIGVKKAKENAQISELLLVVLDSTRDLSDDDRALLRESEGQKRILLLNKQDLPGGLSAEEIKKECNAPVILFSAKTGEGLAGLSARIREDFFESGSAGNEGELISSERQRAELADAKESLEKAAEGLAGGFAEDFITIDLTAAYASTGRILGEEVSDDVIGEIFSRFCVGK